MVENFLGERDVRHTWIRMPPCSAQTRSSKTVELIRTSALQASCRLRTLGREFGIVNSGRLTAEAKMLRSLPGERLHKLKRKSAASSHSIAWN